MASSVSFGMKSGIQPWIGLNAGCGTAGVLSELLDCTKPLANNCGA
jgi:hypothetical protein